MPFHFSQTADSSADALHCICHACHDIFRIDQREAALAGKHDESSYLTPISCKQCHSPLVLRKQTHTLYLGFPVEKQAEEDVFGYPLRLAEVTPILGDIERQKYKLDPFMALCTLMILLLMPGKAPMFAGASDISQQSCQDRSNTSQTLSCLSKTHFETADTWGENSALGGPMEEEIFNHEQALVEAIDSIDGISLKTTLVLPPKENITSYFGKRRDPFNGTYRNHRALDFRVPRGMQIAAAISGKVIFSGRSGAYGNLITISHANGLQSKYAHLSKRLVKKGQNVKRGQAIGTAGSTGRSTGPHLHFELLKNNKRINPLGYQFVHQSHWVASR